MSESKVPTLRSDLWESLQGDPRKYVHLVMIATKPDIIKQAPIYLELKKRGELVLLGHTGQHYDFNLSGGLEQEFGLTPDLNLNIEGPLHQKIAQIIQRLGDLLLKMKTMGKVVIPYVHGDTTTAMAASNAAFANEFASVHVEAGIRTLTLKKAILDQILRKFDAAAYRQLLQDRDNWERGSLEPYPEQFNTRATEPATGLHCAAVPLNQEFLLDEGFRPDRIRVVGNSVADATAMAVAQAKVSTIFDQYPLLKKGFIRFCVHRRENCADEKRFKVIFEAMETLVHEGENILLISLFQTKSAIERFGLISRLEKMREKPNFIYSDVWPFYADVIAAMKQATVCATDSGSMQEEMNILGIPCVTLRFGSDRPETALAGGNLIAPPIDSNLMVKIIRSAQGNKAMAQTPKLYGQNVSKAIVDETLGLLRKEPLFCSEQDRA